MCLICERIEQIRAGENPFFVRELETGYVVIGDHQHFWGYTLFLYKRHVTELHHLARSERLRFLDEMSLVSQAAAQAFGAQKMNVELLGNGDAHLHWHIFPRRDGDLDGYGNAGRGPVWWYPPEKMFAAENEPSAAQLAQLKRRLAASLDKAPAGAQDTGRDAP